ETQAALDALAGGLRLRHGGKHHLLDVAALRRDVTAAVLIENLFHVVVRHFQRFRQFRRCRRNGHDLAVFRRPEHDFALIEIFAELIGGRLRNGAGLRRAERNVLDAALFILKLIDGIEPSVRHRDIARDGIGDLPAQHLAPLLGDKALLVVAGVAQGVREPGAVELALRRLEVRVAGNAPGDFGVGNAEPHLTRALVEPGLGDHFAEHLPIKAERARLFRRDYTAKLAFELLQAVVVGLPELLDRDFRAADLGDGRAAIATENVVDA